MWALSRDFLPGLQLCREDLACCSLWADAGQLLQDGESLTHLEMGNMRPVQIGRHLKRRDCRERIRTRAGPAATLRGAPQQGPHTVGGGVSCCGHSQPLCLTWSLACLVPNSVCCDGPAGRGWPSLALAGGAL